MFADIDSSLSWLLTSVFRVQRLPLCRFSQCAMLGGGREDSLINLNTRAITDCFTMSCLVLWAFVQGKSMEFSDATVQAVWQKARVMPERNPDVWRRDQCGAWLHREQYENDKSEYGWKILKVVAAMRSISRTAKRSVGSRRIAPEWRPRRASTSRATLRTDG
jgi:hypothetical protein